MIQLDVLRGVAILLVLWCHAIVDGPLTGFFHVPSKLGELIGWTGVDLFFVLSGFLVGGLLMEELRLRGSLDVRRFIIRRGFKIWPAYFCLVFGSMIYDAHSLNWRASFQLYLPNLLHVQNYFGSYPLGHTWSLAVEEHFYLILPLTLCLLLWALGPPRAIWVLPWLAGGVIVLCNLLRLHLVGRPFSFPTNYYPTHLRVDALAMGVIIAHFYHFRPQLFARVARHRWALLMAGVLLISPMTRIIVYEPFVWTVGYTMLYVGYGCILTAFVHTPIGPAGGFWGRFFASRLARVVAWIGFSSYSIYLFHLSLAAHPLRRLAAYLNWPHSPGLHWLLWMTVYVATACAVGMVLGRLIELPALAIRDRLFPSRAPSVSMTWDRTGCANRNARHARSA